MGWVAAAVAVVSLIASDRQASRARRDQLDLRGELTPEKILETAQKLYPGFREQVAGALGPQFQQAVAANVGRAGLKDSGLGLTLKNAALAFPDVTAFESAFEAASGIQSQRANQTPLVRQDVLGDMGRAASIFYGINSLGGGKKSNFFDNTTSSRFKNEFSELNPFDR